ncbi:hypothetical protein T12_10537 [Trichinella patagoniensis]|uniref:Uncharacterized protein n=1 Tax=Trichinella patagoniensis TaxID=990121 RepID=A0A0V0Z3R7_9BILA|nr:hypothetical protein T12_10537 [Trichinella patagoniensis]
MSCNDLLIRRISFVNNGWRELKETPSRNWKTLCQAIMFGTIEQLKVVYLPITFGVSEKRLPGQMLDEMRSDAPPR